MPTEARGPSSSLSSPAVTPVPSGVRHYLRVGLSRLYQFWLTLQLGHYGGKYSIERMLELEEYTRETSLVRVLLVCVATPLPMVILVLSQECLPLQDPTAGWQANYGFWIRVGILGGVVAHGVALHTSYFIQGISISSRQLGVIFIAMALGYPAIAILIAAHFVFPIPFMAVSLNVPYVAVLVGTLRATIGGRMITHILRQREQLLRLMAFVSVQLVMSALYPAYQVLFNATKGTHYELLVLLLLPVLKGITKAVLSRTVAHMEDVVPEAVIFTVDFFNALYVATCMQSATSTKTVVTIMVIDFTQTALEIYAMHQRTATIMTRLICSLGATSKDGSLLTAVSKLCRNPEEFEKQPREGIQLRSCMPYPLSPVGNSLLESLEAIHSNKSGLSKGTEIMPTPKGRVSTMNAIAGGHGTRSIATIQPAAAVHVKATRATSAPVADIHAGLRRLTQHRRSVQRLDILCETLETLFTSECLVLTEYLETVIPILYGNYMLVMVHLPSADYHMELDGITSANVGSTVRSLFIYALLEVASFVVLAMLMKINCGLRALYQLAFVLETHMPLLQGKLLIWILMTLAFRVVHFGVDFKFQFDWIGERSP